MLTSNHVGRTGGAGQRRSSPAPRHHRAPPLRSPAPSAAGFRSVHARSRLAGASASRSARAEKRSGLETIACGSGEGGPGAAKGLKCCRGAEGGSGWVSSGLRPCGPGAAEQACWQPAGLGGWGLGLDTAWGRGGGRRGAV